MVNLEQMRDYNIKKFQFKAGSFVEQANDYTKRFEEFEQPFRARRKSWTGAAI